MRIFVVLFLILLSFNSFANDFVNSGKQEKACRTLNSQDLSTYNPEKLKERIIKEQSFSVNVVGYPDICFLTLEIEGDESSGFLNMTRFVLATPIGSVLYQFEMLDVFKMGCQVQAVAFDDLNADEKTDIIVVNQCTAAKGQPYLENVVYWSHQEEGWEVDTAVNAKISAYKTIKAIKKALVVQSE